MNIKWKVKFTPYLVLRIFTLVWVSFYIYLWVHASIQDFQHPIDHTSLIAASWVGLMGLVTLGLEWVFRKLNKPAIYFIRSYASVLGIAGSLLTFGLFLPHEGASFGTITYTVGILLLLPLLTSLLVYRYPLQAGCFFLIIGTIWFIISIYLILLVPFLIVAGIIAFFGSSGDTW